MKFHEAVATAKRILNGTPQPNDLCGKCGVPFRLHANIHEWNAHRRQHAFEVQFFQNIDDSAYNNEA